MKDDGNSVVLILAVSIAASHKLQYLLQMKNVKDAIVKSILRYFAFDCLN